MACDNFAKRPVGYKVAVGIQVMGALLLIVGYTAPYWMEANDGSVYGGLWSECVKWSDTCNSMTADQTAGWMTAVQVLETLGLLGVVVSCACTIFENSCWQDVNSPRLLQELATLFGGIFSVIGWVVFLACTHSSYTANSYDHSWAFYLTVIASVLAVIAGVALLFCSKMKLKSIDLPPLWSGDGSRAGEVSPAPRRQSDFWADWRPGTPQGEKVEGGASEGIPHGFYSLPPLPPITSGHDGDVPVSRSPPPSYSEPRMSIISMSAEQVVKGHVHE